jgi:F420-dependent oxidoreductase-like protein
MRVGLQVPDFTWPGGPQRLGETFGAIAERAERAGFTSFWVMDHFFQIAVVGPPEHEMLEGWSALAYAAGRTSRIRLGTMVTGVTYRHPGILVKTATTLDVLSGGRAYFGVGAAWNEDEHRGLGVPFSPLGERIERLEETLQIALQMWSGDETPYRGKHYQLERPLNSPQSLQRPHPPILVGGAGERKTLRLVARYADACNLFAFGDNEVLRHKLDVLRGHCEAVGRPYEDIEKTSLGHISLTRDGRGSSLTPDAAVEYFAKLAALGIDHGIVSLRNVHEEDVFDLLASEVIPAVERMVVAGR